MTDYCTVCTWCCQLCGDPELTGGACPNGDDCEWVKACGREAQDE